MRIEPLARELGVEHDRMLVTRESLLSRLRHPGNESWREFFEIYWKLIYSMAIKSGLSDAEAQEVVQETMIGVSRNIPNYTYDPARCSFKSWLMNLVQWRIRDQVRRREEHAPISSVGEIAQDNEFARAWDEDWERNFVQVALDRVKQRVSPREFQIFSCCVLQEKGVAETARLLNINRARVYLAHHRIAREVKREIAELRRNHPKEP